MRGDLRRGRPSGRVVLAGESRRRRRRGHTSVNRQVEFLVESDEVSDDRNFYGFVYDFQGAYGGARGRTSLVNVDGETEPGELRERMPDRHDSFVRSLLG